MKHIILFLTFIALLAEEMPAQTYRQYMKAADEEFDDKNYYSAMKHYQMAMDIEGEKPEVLYKYAESARLFSSYTFADTAYTKVITADSTGRYPEAKYWLATVKKKTGAYETAQDLFREFAETHGNSHPKLAEAAREEVDALNWAIEAITFPDEDVEVTQLDENVNSPYSEFAPIQVGDEIYFSTQNYFRQVKKGKDPYPFSIVMKKNVDSGEIERAAWNDLSRHTAHAAFTDDMSRVYYTLCDYVGETAEIRCELYYRDRNELSKWKEPVRLPASINQSGFTVSDPRLGRDKTTGEQWLFFVSDRTGGLGGLDIWRTTIGKDGSFSTPVNLKELNTPGDEITPMFHDPSQTLYFSSDGRQGFGGFDIYRTILKDGKWKEIEHMPAPYNTSYNDTHFWMDRSRTRGFFASSRLGSHVLEPEFEACCNDIYQFTIQVVDLDIHTFSKKDSSGLNGVTVRLFELTPNGSFNLSTVTNDDGNDYHFELKRGNKYVTVATRDGYLTYTDTIDMNVPEYSDKRKITREYYLIPDEVDLDIFSFNKKTLQPLKGVEVRLVVDGQEIDFQSNNNGNQVSFDLPRGQLYQIIGSKVAYFSDTVMIDLRTDTTTTQLERKLMLQPKEIEDFPPLVIYFDNDYPNPRTWKTTTEKSYRETWEAYMDKKDLYVKEYVKSLAGFDSITTARRMEAFFDREVRNGYLSLQVFTENILEIMQEGGFKVELIIQGFTSPRASADYNYNLSKRRSDCLKNHFERWKDGVLQPYIDQNRIIMKVVGYGEELAPQFISDRLDDERESIYSVQASFERKVAIIGARRVAEN